VIENDLDRRLAEFYAEESLSRETLERLLAEAEAPRTRRPWLRWGAAAAALLLGAALFRIVDMRLVERDPVRLSRAVASEILGHDRRKEPIDFPAASFDALQGAMPKLDFALVEPRRLKEEGLRLVGARYCSIRGGLAAQIKLRGANGEIRNLYQAPIRPRLRALAGGEIDVDGARVTIWREGNVMLGMARGGAS
jgi:hypothetical protein